MKSDISRARRRCGFGEESSETDELLPGYGIQLNVYCYLLKENQLGSCNHTALVYSDPQTHLSASEAEKKAGLIENYSIFLNTTKANADDWDIGFSISYKNFAALDGLAQKVLDLRMKQYGDKSKEQQVIDKRVQNARTVASILTREITLK